MRDIWKEGIRLLTRKEKACPECDGQGWVEVYLGERMCSGMGGPYEPIEREHQCEECRGEGRELCHEHPGEEVVACWLQEPSETLCESCLEKLGTSLEEVRMEVIQRAAQDPMIQMEWGREPT